MKKPLSSLLKVLKVSFFLLVALYIIMMFYLEAHPNAVIIAWDILFINVIGFFLANRRYNNGKMTNPCTVNPTHTVAKYHPNCPTTVKISSISMILDDTKKSTPTGERKITHEVIFMLTAIKLWKKLAKTSASLPSWAMAMPRAAAMTTRPNMLVL